MTPPVRTFEDRPAKRERTPLFVGIIGPSGTGKTFSALRLASGIQKVSGGDIFVIDTEARRSLHYADRFTFRHLPFGAPFSPLDYLAAIEHCVAKGAKTIVIDSMSHEHEGPGGVLEEHAAEVERLSALWKVRGDAANFPAWAVPKAKRNRLRNTLQQITANFVFTFRAEEKAKPGGDRKLIDLGYQPIAGRPYIYDLTAKFLLLPGADGVPTWESDIVAEKAMMKKPEQFVDLLRNVKQLDEATGQAMAQWAAGVPDAPSPSSLSTDDVLDLLARYTACSDAATFRALEDERKTHWAALGKDPKAALKTASDAAKKRIDAPVDAPEPGSAG